jgi:CheY-like chemotaxis protein
MRRILIVDDQVGPNMTLAELLRASGYCVDSAYSATGGINHLGAVGSELVVLNLTLPDAQGWKVLDYVRRLPFEQRPVVIVHSRLSPAQWEQAKASGANELWLPGECSFWSMCDSLEHYFEPVNLQAA